MDYLVKPEKGIIALPDVTKGTDLPMWPHMCMHSNTYSKKKKKGVWKADILISAKLIWRRERGCVGLYHSVSLIKLVLEVFVVR